MSPVVKVKRKPLWVLEMVVSLKDGETITERVELRGQSIADLLEDKAMDEAMNKIAWEALEQRVDEKLVTGLAFKIEKLPKLGPLEHQS